MIDQLFADLAKNWTPPEETEGKPNHHQGEKILQKFPFQAIKEFIEFVVKLVSRKGENA